MAGIVEAVAAMVVTWPVVAPAATPPSIIARRIVGATADQGVFACYA